MCAGRPSVEGEVEEALERYDRQGPCSLRCSTAAWTIEAAGGDQSRGHARKGPRQVLDTLRASRQPVTLSVGDSEPQHFSAIELL